MLGQKPFGSEGRVNSPVGAYMQSRIGRAGRRSFVAPAVVQHADLGDLTLQSRHYHHYHGDGHGHSIAHCGFDHNPDGTPKL